jgi:hypothetical protein
MLPISRPIESVGLEAFLHERVMLIEHQDITVRDLIDHLANVAGGVHAGKAREDHSHMLNLISEQLEIGGMNSPIRCLRGIVIVVAKALKPLRDAIVG